jgi:signal transduction histidine kinase
VRHPLSIAFGLGALLLLGEGVLLLLVDGLAGGVAIMLTSFLMGVGVAWLARREFDRAVAAHSDAAAQLARQTERAAAFRQQAESLEARLEQTARELLRQREEAAAEAKGEFIAKMSHELRRPLNNLAGYISLLRDEVEVMDGARRVHILDRLEANSQALTTTVNRLLELGQLEEGLLKIEAEHFVVRRWLDDVTADLGAAIRSRGLAFEVKVADDVPVRMINDPLQLGKVVGYLLSNALKFTQEGSISVSLEQEAGHYRLRVRDTGIGIPPDKQPQIFEPFRQGDDSHGRRYDGSGLTLTLAFRLVRLLGGTIELQSEVGKGSTFEVILPLKGSEDPTQPAAPDGGPWEGDDDDGSLSGSARLDRAGH